MDFYEFDPFYCNPTLPALILAVSLSIKCRWTMQKNLFCGIFCQMISAAVHHYKSTWEKLRCAHSALHSGPIWIFGKISGKTFWIFVFSWILFIIQTIIWWIEWYLARALPISFDATSKGQIIWNLFFSCRGFSQKTNENTSHTSKNEFIRSFFGRIHGLTICFRN